MAGRLDFGPVHVAQGAMGVKHRALPDGQAIAALQEPGVLLEIIPHVDGTPRTCELVVVHLT